MAESLSPQQARKLVLLSQRVPPAKQSGTAMAATLSAIEHLGYIQIDTISVIERDKKLMKSVLKRMDCKADRKESLLHIQHFAQIFPRQG